MMSTAATKYAVCMKTYLAFVYPCPKYAYVHHMCNGFQKGKRVLNPLELAL